MLSSRVSTSLFEVSRMTGMSLSLGAVVVGAQAVGYFLHLLQRVDNQGERRANVVGGVDEELHLGLLELALLAAIVVEQQL